MRDLLSDPLPLRDTRVWPGYDEVKVIDPEFQLSEAEYDAVK